MTTPAQPARILIVDDEPGILRRMSRVLGPRYTVATCNDATEAVSLARTFQPDLGLLDIRMPKLDGFRLMQRLREQDPELDVILMTGNFDETDGDLLQALDRGAFFYVQKPVDRRVLLALVSCCIERRQLERERNDHLAQLSKDLELARAFQKTLMPRSTSFPGFDVQRWFRPCHQLAGDYYDFVTPEPDRLVFCVADVMGHGTRAAMMTGSIKVAFADAERHGYRPRDVVRHIHDVTVPFADQTFVTVFCGEIRRGRIGQGEATRLTFASAGHPYALVVSPREVRRLPVTGPLVSFDFARGDYDEERIDLAPDERILAHTDGLTDVENAAGMPLDRRQLETMLSELATSPRWPLEDLEQRVLAFAEGGTIFDDITAVLVTVVPPTA